MQPTPSSARCGEGVPWLALHPSDPVEPMTVDLELWVSEPGEYRMEIRADGELELAEPIAQRTLPSSDPCVWSSGSFNASQGPLPLTIRTTRDVAVQHFELVAGGKPRR